MKPNGLKAATASQYRVGDWIIRSAFYTPLVITDEKSYNFSAPRSRRRRKICDKLYHPYGAWKKCAIGKL